MNIDLPDSNLLINAIVWKNPVAEAYLNDIVTSQRYIFIPRYVIAETHNKSTAAASKKGERHCLDVLEFLHGLNTTLMAHPRNVLGDSRFYQYYTAWNDYTVTPNNLREIRNSSMAILLSDILDDLERKDAPVLAEAHKLCRLSEPAVLADLGNHSDGDLYSRQEEMLFGELLKSKGVSNLKCIIQTNDKDFSKVDPSQVGVDHVTVEKIDLG